MKTRHVLSPNLTPYLALALSAALCLLAASAHALSDTQHRRMLKTSPAYAQADAELGRAWKALREALEQNGLADQFDGGTNPPAPGSLLAEQRAWLRSGRDQEAKALRGGGSEADGYAAATRERAAYLRERAAALTASPGAATSRVSVAPADDARTAYLEAARTFVRERRLPDGNALDDALSTGNFADNALAIRDVDGDGRPEFLIKIKSAPMAGMQEFVYGFDVGSGRLVEKLSGFPDIEYFSNGCAKEPISHNQGMAGDFWPFTLHRLNTGTGKYESLGFVDAWSEAAFPTSYEGKPFPKHIDAVGDGYVYFLHIDPEADPTKVEPVDTPVYKAWLGRCVGGATPVKVHWVKANAQGLEALRRQE